MRLPHPKPFRAEVVSGTMARMKHRIAPALIALSVCAALAAPATAGDIIRPDAASDFKWSSTECVRPAKPFIREGDPNRQGALRMYAASISRYIDCLKREAQRDFDRAQLQMQKDLQADLQKKVDELNDDMERTVVNSR